MKKLIPALCMLLVAACLMGTSTYAWFSANEAVSASGMQVKAAADGGLAIAAVPGTKGTAEAMVGTVTADMYGSSATVGWANIADGATVKPVSSYNGKWTSGAAVNNEFHTADTSKYADATANTTSYYQKSLWKIKTLDTSAGASYNVKVTGVTVTLDDATKDVYDTEEATSAMLNKSLRVAIHVTNAATGATSWFYFAPAYTSANAAGLKCYNPDGTPDKVVAYPNIAGQSTEVVIFEGLELNELCEFEVYVYYEGEDENCTTKNTLLGIDHLNVELDFGATKVS